MASHLSTPQSVLTAPSPMTWTAFAPVHPNRASRRAYGFGGVVRNEPYVRTAPRRGKRVRRHPESK